MMAFRNYFFFIYNLLTLRLRGKKILIILNFHRIGEKKDIGPYKQYHSVSLDKFIRQINVLKYFGKFISLNQFESFDNLAFINLIISFDDVSTSIFEVLPFLTKNEIPFVIAPNVLLTEKGYGDRDKVYYILDSLNQVEIQEHINSIMGNRINLINDFSFYKWSKSGVLHPEEMEKKIIDPIFEKCNIKYFSSTRNYLNWEDILRLLYENKFSSIANHGFKHYNYLYLNRLEILNDINKSQQIFSEKINLTPDIFVLPYGCMNNNLDSIFKFYDYFGFNYVLLVDNKVNIISKSAKKNNPYLSRIHSGESFNETVKTIIAAIANYAKK